MRWVAFWLVNATRILGLLLAIGLAVLWPRSHWVADSLWIYTPSPWQLRFRSDWGELYVTAWGSGPHTLGVSYDHASAPFRQDYAPERRVPGTRQNWHLAGFWWCAGGGGPVRGFTLPPERVVAVPHWFAVGLAAWAGLALRRHAKRMRPPEHARQTNMCSSCCYDLTGNLSGICPECGQALEAII
jgi:hypothetical protein